METRMPPAQKRWAHRGSLLLEASIALGMTSVLALIVMRSSLLAISGNQWTSMQTLTDAYLTRETALANRTPLADVLSAESSWPELIAEAEIVPTEVPLGRLPGGHAVTGALSRYRISVPFGEEPSFGPSLWRLHSQLRYHIGEDEYVKTRTTLRIQ